MRRTLLITCVIAGLLLIGFGLQAARPPVAWLPWNPAPRMSFTHHASPRAQQFARAAEAQVGRTVIYDPDYVEIGYPGGDVPMERGVCTDVVVRAFRALGTDLQVEVHEDMAAHFDEYPRKWRLREPDTNIDHRRVPNLQVYFRRMGKAAPITAKGSDYWPGDIVTWKTGKLPHTGIVSTVPATDGSRYCIAHNHGSGVQIEDFLFRYEITGHYRPF